MIDGLSDGRVEGIRDGTSEIDGLIEVDGFVEGTSVGRYDGFIDGTTDG